VQVMGLTGAEAIDAGYQHSLALNQDGTGWAWGDNTQGQLGDGTTTDRHTAVQVLGVTGVEALVAGSDFSLALNQDGTVWAWGYNRNGQLGDGSVRRSTPAPIPGLSLW
jgi:alpha-tubulin suppressor-like RCC1 family protein